MPIFILIVIGISLSMDAFSLALLYGTQNLERKTINILSIVVGIYHFIMPILGYILGNKIFEYIKINSSILIGIIFIAISIQMILSINKEENIKTELNMITILIFGLIVSIDSFTIGIGFSSIYKNIIEGGIIFSLISAFFTYLGLNLGTKIATKYGSFTTLIGSIILFCLGLHYIF